MTARARAVAAAAPLGRLTAEQRAVLVADCEALAALDDAEFGVRFLAGTPTHEGRPRDQLLRWARIAEEFGAGLAMGESPIPPLPETGGKPPDPHDAAAPAPALRSEGRAGGNPRPGPGHGHEPGPPPPALRDAQVNGRAGGNPDPGPAAGIASGGDPVRRARSTAASGADPARPAGGMAALVHHTPPRVVERTGGLDPERLLLARYTSRPPAVELYTDTLALADELIGLLGDDWRCWYPPGSIRAAALAHEGVHQELHHGPAKAALRAALDHTALRIGRRRIRAHVAGADELAAHGYARAACGLGRSPLLLTAALARAVELHETRQTRQTRES